MTNPIDDAQLAKLRELAMAATPGQRLLGNENDACCDVAYGSEGSLQISLDREDCNTGQRLISREEMLANAHLIIATPPATILQLLDHIALLRKDAQTLLKLMASDREKIERLNSILGMDNPWPLHDVLAKLAEAAGILLGRHDHDGHGYELIRKAQSRAVEIIGAISAAQSQEKSNV